MMKKITSTFAASVLFAAALGVGQAALADPEERYDLWLSKKDGNTVVAAAESKPDGAYAVASGKKNLQVLSGEKAEKAFAALKDKAPGERIAIFTKKGVHKEGAHEDGEHKKVIHKEVKVWTSKEGENVEFNEDLEFETDLEFHNDMEFGGDVEIHGNGEHEVIIVKSSDDSAEEKGAKKKSHKVKVVRLHKKDGAASVDSNTVVDVLGDKVDTKINVVDGKIIIKNKDGETIISDALESVDLAHKNKLVIETIGDEKKERFVRISGADGEAAADFIDEQDGLSASEKAAMKKAINL